MRIMRIVYVWPHLVGGEVHLLAVREVRYYHAARSRFFIMLITQPSLLCRLQIVVEGG